MKINPDNLLIRSGRRLLVYSLMLTAMSYLILFDASIVRENNPFSENSLSEIAQIVFLALTVLSFAVAGRYKGNRLNSIFLSAAFLCALVRELDSSFDALFDGAWQSCVSLILLVTAILLIRKRKQFVRELSEFLRNPVAGILFSGFLTVMVFSRFFGRELLWLEIMGDGFMRSVKNAAEECVELFGYFLCLVSGIEYLLSRKASAIEISHQKDLSDKEDSLKYMLNSKTLTHTIQ